jgi:hypothetical protein
LLGILRGLALLEKEFNGLAVDDEHADDALRLRLRRATR